jgi:hypothetical protein
MSRQIAQYPISLNVQVEGGALGVERLNSWVPLDSLVLEFPAGIQNETGLIQTKVLDFPDPSIDHSLG